MRPTALLLLIPAIFASLSVSAALAPASPAPAITTAESPLIPALPSP